MAGNKVERKDKLKTQAKIVKEVLKAPLDTMEKIAKKVGCNKSTISRNMKEVQQKATKDDRIVGITDKDLKILELTQGVTINRLLNPEEESFSDIIRAGAESAKRVMLFGGDVTNKDGGLKDTSALEKLNSL